MTRLRNAAPAWAAACALVSIQTACDLGPHGSMATARRESADAPTASAPANDQRANELGGAAGSGVGALQEQTAALYRAVDRSNARSTPGAARGAFGRSPAVRNFVAATPAARSPEDPTAGAAHGMAPLPQADPVPHLDPNARYATTYRPGGAALAAFDAAVARGQIPPIYQDLAAELGARHAIPIAAPDPGAGALAVAVATGRGAVGPSGGSIDLGVTLASSEIAPPRAPLSVHIVLDRSGSMEGRAIDDAKRAAQAVVARLEPDDDFSLVTFSDEARLLVADGRIGPRRGQAVAAIDSVQAGGGTNISAGLDLAYAQARSRGAEDRAVSLVMLLSDGRANYGDTDPDRLADRAASAFHSGVQTSAFGLGPDFDGALMSRIADRGAGGYYYLADSSQIAPALERELDARVRPVATAIELRVRLRPDVAAAHVFGSRELSAAQAAAVRAQELAIDVGEQKHAIAADRQHEDARGMRFVIPAFAPADRHTTIVTLRLPPGRDERAIATVELRYKDRLLGKNVTRELPVRMRWAASDAESAATEDPTLARVVQGFGAGEAILEAAERVDAGDRNGARRLLDERAELLKAASERLGDPLLAEDGGRVARMSAAVGGDQPIEELPLVIMLRAAGYGRL
ncbi:MAG TPA: VWA domain-containing protein [Polyangiaceae bacterium]|nr:VWA domain-containing protein [Polyangiaceae bacterium]